MAIDRTEFLKLPDTTDADRIAALKSYDLQLVLKDENGKELLGGVYNHEVAAQYFPSVILSPAVLDRKGNVITPAVVAGPHMMIRYVSGSRYTEQETRLESCRRARENGEKIPLRKDLDLSLADVELQYYQ